MIKGIGTDIIEISRIRASISRHHEHFLNKIFSVQEQEYCLRHHDAAVHFAGRFAAKEAVIKAIGVGFSAGFSWLDIEIHNNKDGKPEVLLSSMLNKMLKHPQILISISHCREYATSTAILLYGE